MLTFGWRKLYNSVGRWEGGISQQDKGAWLVEPCEQQESEMEDSDFLPQNCADFAHLLIAFTQRGIYRAPFLVVTRCGPLCHLRVHQAWYNRSRRHSALGYVS